MRLKSYAAISALGMAAAALAAQSPGAQPSAASAPRPGQAVRPDPTLTAPPSSALAANRYADPALCEACHAGIANTYHKTGMGRSFFRLQPANAVEDFTPGKAYFHEASNTYIAMIERGGKYYQRRWQEGITGAQINVDEKTVDFVIGSGNHGRTYVHLTGANTLQELPLGWYAEKGGYWAMAPGFDRADYPGSTRAVTYECMFCHNAYPNIPPGHEEPGAQAEFLLPFPEGIDCQRCHGPGQRHIDIASRSGATAQQIRASIVNPQRLSPERELEVCMQCHLETTSTALPHDLVRSGRGPFSYIPGRPLGDFRIAFDRAGGMGDRFEVAGAAYRMRLSACFLKSNGNLRCTTCHDPHNIPRGEAAAVHYNGVCRQCHASLAAAHPAGPDCIACHTPKRRTDDAVHVVMTDHFIRARQPSGDLLADKREIEDTPATSYRGQVVPYHPLNLAATTTPAAEKPAESALLAAAAQIIERSNLKEGIPRLEALIGEHHPRSADYYMDLADALAATGQPAKAVPYLEQAARLAPASAIVLRKLGSAQMHAGRMADAEATLRRVTSFAPDDDASWGLLAQLLTLEGARHPGVACDTCAPIMAEAKADFERAIAIDPEVPELRTSFATMLFGTDDSESAERQLREAVRIQPGVAAMQANLASVLASRGETVEARFHFEACIRLQPDFAPARLNYAHLLAGLGDAAGAEKQARAALQANDRLADAHELLGSLLEGRNDLDGAEPELRAAVRLRPDFAQAHFELAVILARKGDIPGAVEHLKIAAQGSDPNAKASAERFLQYLAK